MEKRKIAQSLVEYGLILALIAVVAVTVLGKFSTSATKADAQKITTTKSTSINTLQSYCKSINKIYDENNGTCK